MSAPIDPQLAAFIIQAVREAVDDNQRRPRRYSNANTNSNTNSNTNTNDSEPYHSRSNSCGFGSRTNLRQPMPSFLPQTNFGKVGVNPTWDEITTGGNTRTASWADTTTTKKVVINDGQTKTSDVFHPSTSRYPFAQPTNTPTSNPVVNDGGFGACPQSATSCGFGACPQSATSGGFGSCIPNQNKQNPFAFISNKNLKPVTTGESASSGGFGACPQSASSGGFGAPRKQPPSYPPPVYSKPPELILDSTSESESEDERPEFSGLRRDTEFSGLMRDTEFSGLMRDTESSENKQNVYSSGKKSSLMEAFDAKVPDALTNILSDLLGVNITEELTSLANELSGTSTCATNKPSTTTNSQEKAQQKAQAETTSTTSAHEFRDAYAILQKYLKNIMIDYNVIHIINRYIYYMLRTRLIDASILTEVQMKMNRNPEMHTRVVRAICRELTITNRIDDLEAMIKNMPVNELRKFTMCGSLALFYNGFVNY